MDEAHPHAPMTRRQIRELRTASTPVVTAPGGIRPISAEYSALPVDPAQPGDPAQPADSATEAATTPTPLVFRQSTGTKDNDVVPLNTEQSAALGYPNLLEETPTDTPATGTTAPRRERGSGRRPRPHGLILTSFVVACCAVPGSLTASQVLPLTAPVIVSGPADGEEVASENTAFEVSTSGAARLECKLDAGPWKLCNPSFTVSGLSNGAHTLQVKSIAGTMESPAVTRSWLVHQRLAPAEFSTGPDDASTVYALPISYGIWTAKQADSTQCRVDQGPWVDCDGIFTVSDLSIGKHTVSVRSEQAATQVHERTIEVADPETRVQPRPNVGTDGDDTGAEPEAGTDGTSPDPKPSDPDNPDTPGDIGTPSHSSPGNSTSPKPDAPRRTTPVTPTIPDAGRPNTSASYGVPPGTKLTVHRGDLEITTPGARIDALDVHGFVLIKAPNVKITRSIIRGNSSKAHTALISTKQPGVIIEDTELSPSHPYEQLDGIKGYGFTARRLNIHDVVDSVFIYGDNAAVLNSWLHNHRYYSSTPAHGGGPTHNDGVQIQGGTGQIVSGNRIEDAHNAAIMLTQDRTRSRGVRITNNYLSGGGCTVNIADKGKGAFIDLVVSGNRFGTSREHNCPIVASEATKRAIKATNNTWAKDGSPARVHS